MLDTYDVHSGCKKLAFPSTLQNAMTGHQSLSLREAFYSRIPTLSLIGARKKIQSHHDSTNLSVVIIRGISTELCNACILPGDILPVTEANWPKMKELFTRYSLLETFGFTHWMDNFQVSYCSST